MQSVLEKLSQTIPHCLFPRSHRPPPIPETWCPTFILQLQQHIHKTDGSTLYICKTPSPTLTSGIAYSRREYYDI